MQKFGICIIRMRILPFSVSFTAVHQQMWFLFLVHDHGQKFLQGREELIEGQRMFVVCVCFGAEINEMFPLRNHLCWIYGDFLMEISLQGSKLSSTLLYVGLLRMDGIVGLLRGMEVFLTLGLQ